MKLVLLFSIFLLSCSTKNNIQVLPNDEDYLVGLEFMRKGQLDQASPLMKKSCFAGLLAACQSIGEIIDRSKMTGLSILQGATDESSTQLNIIVPKSMNVYPIIWQDLKMLKDNQYTFEIISRSYSDSAVMKVAIKGLKKNVNYRIDFLSEKSELLDSRFFKTLDNSARDLKFIIASCMDDAYDELQKQIWPEVISLEPDVLFLIGDNTYADRLNGVWLRKLGADEKSQWIRNTETRQKLSLYKIENLIPIFATWDDHDFGKNDGNKYFAHAADSQVIFNTFWSQTNNNFLKRSHGVSSHLKLRGHNFFFMDNRSFRDPKDDRLGDHFGDDQEKWLFKGLKKSKNYNWIISGDQFFGSHHPWESYEGNHPNKFKEFLTNVKRSKSKVFLISGDRHLTELQEVGKSEIGSDTFELTSSGVHAHYFKNTFKKFGSKRMIEGAGGVSNYVLLQSTAGNPIWKVRVEAYSKGKKVLYSRDLEVK